MSQGSDTTGRRLRAATKPQESLAVLWSNFTEKIAEPENLGAVPVIPIEAYVCHKVIPDGAVKPLVMP